MTEADTDSLGALLQAPARCQALLRTLLASCSDHVYLYDRAGRYLHASPAGARALGLDPGDIRGRHWRELGFPEDVMEAFDRDRERVFDTGEPLSHATAFPTLRGVRQYQYSLHPLFAADGEVDAAVCIAQERHLQGDTAASGPDGGTPQPLDWARETQLRLVADALPSLVSYVDSEERYRFNNKAYQEWFGIPPEELNGRTVREVVGAEAYERLRDRVASVLAGEGVSFTEDVPYRAGRRLVHVRYIPDQAQDGRVRGFFAVVDDLRRPPSSEADEASASASQRPPSSGLRALGEMTAEILHEISQPVTAIASYAEASIRAARSPVPDSTDDLVEWLHGIQSQAVRAKEIIQRFRGFLRGGRLRRTRLDLNGLISNVADQIRDRHREAGVELRLDPAPAACRVSADPLLLEQALRNLLSNALEASAGAQARTGEVCIRARCEGTLATVEVLDRGPGVPPELGERVFEPFFSTKDEGVGIGLAIARAVIEAHGGALTLSETPGGGATFRFLLPLAPESGHDPSG